MLELDLHRAFAEKGIDNPNKFLRKLGYSVYLTSRILNNYHSAIKFKHLEDICLALNCTLDNLFKWTPDKDSNVPENHPMQKLKARNDDTLTQKLSKLSFEKIEQVRKYVDEIK
jgi:DNA-binding Xre family transcriptional regulator